MKRFAFVFIALFFLFANGQASAAEKGLGNSDPASYGLAKKTLVKGQTTQQQVLETFGAPNITTKGTGEVAEVWTYEKVSSEYAASKLNLGIGGLGGGGGGSGGGSGGAFAGYGKQKGGSSVRTVTLIIKFDTQEVVSDYKIMETNF